MKKLIPLVLISLFLTSFTTVNKHYFLLDNSDFEFMREDNEEPALSIPYENFNSYNKWQCFDTSEVEVNLADINYDNWHQVPSLSTEKMDFDLDPDISWDAEKVIANWDALIRDSRSICIFGAFLQNNEEKSFWYIQKIKTQNGYWDREDYLNFLAPEDNQTDD